MTDTASTEPSEAPAAPTDAAPSTEPDTGEVVAVMQELGLEPKQLAERLRASRKWEERAKTNFEELEQLRQQSMTEQERAIVQAKAEARAEAITETSTRVAAAEVRAAAAGRLAPTQVAALLEHANLASFISEGGEVDTVKVARFIEGIAPAPTESSGPESPFDLGQGARGTSTPLNGDPILRQLKSQLGIQ